ncbi:MAG: ABC transporter substrate-binding protein, partial [Bacillota bacterium]
AKSIEITVWHGLAGDAKKAFEQLCDEFNASQDKVKVKPTFVVFVEMARKIDTAIAAGAPPDVAILGVAYPPRLIAANVLTPIDDLATPEQMADIKSDLYSTYLDFLTKGGKLWSVPAGGGCMVLYYNKDMFAAAGLDPDVPPQTWDDVVRFGKKLTNPAKNQWGFRVYSINADWLLSQYLPMLWQNGGEFLNADNTAAAFNSPEGVETLQFLVDAVHKHKISPLVSLEFTQAAGLFQTGTIGMMMHMETLYGGFQSLSFKWGVAPLPQVKKRATWIGGWYPVIFKGSRNQDAAWQFVHWLTKDAQIAWSKGIGTTPARKSVVQSPPYQQYLVEHPKRAAFVEGNKYGRFKPAIPEYEAISKIFTAEAEKALYQKVSVKQALDDAAAKVNEILRK